MKTLAPLFTLLLFGCAVGPDYHRPEVVTPAAYKETGDWKPAQPKDEVARGNWWEIYGDAELNKLVPQVEISNQNIIAAVAQYRQAVALLQGAQANYYPKVDGSLAGTRAQGASSSTSGSSSTTSGSSISKTTRLALSASWEPDLWGQIGRDVEANKASAQASKADLQSALLSAQGTLVQSYLQLRITDEKKRLLDQTIAAYERSLQITQNRYDAGVAGRIDVVQADTQLKTTQAQAIDLGVQRAQLEHAIAVLIGKTPAEFQIQPTTDLPNVPSIPPTLPSELLERRPDIAGAERRMAAANAEIGVAQAAFFPALTLNGTGGYQSSSGLSQLATLPNRFWSIGPTLALTLFDGGARSAAKQSAVAAYDQSVASYRQTVLSAFQEVEDDLASLRLLEDEATVQQAAAQSAGESLALTENQYKSGTVSYLNVVVAQATDLTAKSTYISVAGRRLLAHAALINALGGDWQKRKE